MGLWSVICAAGAVVIVVLTGKIILLYRDLEEIGAQFDDRLEKDTNNRIYVTGNDRHIRAFAERLNRELGVLYESRRRYQNGDRELREAVTNISPDLRTPLTAIYGYLELAEGELGRGYGTINCTSQAHGTTSCTSQAHDNQDRELEHRYGNLNGERVAHYLAQIRNRAEAMRALTEELFRYSIIFSTPRESTGNLGGAADAATVMDSNKESVVLNRFLADCLLSYYDIFTQNCIEPEISITDEEVVRFLDTGALKRVFCNILDNAVKYSKPAQNGCVDGTCPGQAVLSVELRSDGTIIFRNSAQELDWVSCERLFDRFYTVETGRNSTGLGLSIAKLLTERMGGRISAAYTDGMLEITVRL